MRSPTHTHPRWLLACALLATAGACTLGDAALSVTVQVAPAATTTRCVKVVAVPAGAPEAATDPIPRPADKDALAVAVYQGQLPESLSVVARGYDGPDCTRLNEESVPNAVRFVRGQVTAVTLRLEGSACVRPGADAGTLCLSGVCRTDQACADAGTEFDCLNGTDDDGDGKVDCRDPDCFQLACASANQCVTSPTCQADGGCGGPLLACDAPPTFCAVAVGTCSPSNGTCTYPGDTTRSCDDTNACTSPDTCRADGGCGGTPVTCGPPPGVCFGPSTGCDPDAGCLYPVKADAGCSDGDACTFADRCAPDGGCAGTPYSCSDTECTTGSACTGDGGCTSAPRTGQLCTGGVCTDAGSCLTFPYTPSNFDPVVVAAAGIGGPVTLNCNAWFNSTDGGRSWCSGQPFPVMSAVTQSGGPDAVVLAMSGLTVSSGGSLALVGSRPVILAVYGNASVSGTLSARSYAGGDAGAGSSSTGSCDAQDGAQSTNEGGGGGGGGYGTSGGDGGSGAAPATGGRRGLVNGATSLVPLRGGCRGGNGGRPTDSARNGGTPGEGGGAVQLSAAGLLTVSGTVTASGQGGEGGLRDQNGVSGGGGNGGGGGGSGGALLLEGQDVDVKTGAHLTANGGGGGEGGDGSTSGNNGASGGDGDVSASTSAAGGAGQVSCAGDGARGGSAAGDAGSGVGPSSGGCGAGGGGGAAGRIRVNGSRTCGVDAGSMSPAPAFGGICP